MAGWKERSGTSRSPQARREEKAGRGESIYLGERYGTDSKLQGRSSKMLVERESDPWKAA